MPATQNHGKTLKYRVADSSLAFFKDLRVLAG
jgi:hypothetical protein